jgi:hypothetical protein
MSLCDAIDIHYINLSSNKLYRTTGLYRVDDMHVNTDNEDTVAFSWLISGNVTTYAGTLTFAISFKCLNDSMVDYAWHTDAYTGIEIENTLQIEGSDVVLEYYDVITQWKNELFGEGDSAVNRIKEAEKAALEAIDQAGVSSFSVDEKTLIIEDGIMRVNTTNDVEEDNTQPITSAAVYATVGNISAILDTI